MAGFDQSSTGIDGYTPNGYESKPRVSLPALPNRLPAAPRNGYYPVAAEPNAMSLNNYSPSLPATPQVNLPTTQTQASYLSDTPQFLPTQNDLEGRLRGMILSNGVPDGPTSSRTVPEECHGRNQRGSRRPNQAQRRQQRVPSSSNVPSNAPINNLPPNRVSRELDPAQGFLPGQSPAVQYQLPHLRGLAPERSLSGNSNRSQGSHHFSPQHELPDHRMGLSPSQQFFSARNQSYNRPPPTNRQLYNPSPYGMQSHHAARFQEQPIRAGPDTQFGYLENLAQAEIIKAEISQEEFLEKQELRKTLEEVCRKAVSEYEMHKAKDAAFVPESVELRCFGSLSTTFATKSSDMDLVLVSPMSEPETSSPESDLPRLIERALLSLGYGARLLTKTRVPIIRFCEKPTPELANSLLAERTKYEKERDATPTTKNPKMPKQKEKVSDKPKSPVAQGRANDIAANESTVEVKDLNMVKCVEKGSPNVSEAAKPSGSSPSENAQKKLKSPSQRDGEGQSKKLVDDRESDDPSLVEKSDVERARLYKLAIQDGWYEPRERQIIKTFLSALKEHGILKSEKSLGNKLQILPSDEYGSKSNDNEQLEKARAALQTLPNVLGRYRPPPAAHPLDFPKEGVGIQCDINFSNHLALHNSHLLKCYACCDPRVRRMVLFVKAWSKKRKINTPYHGTLSSYGYVLMVLHYLVNIAYPPVLPNLQASPLRLQDEISAKEVLLEGYNVQFFRNEEKILDLARRGQLTRNQEPLGSLLQGFFHYFAQQGYRAPSGGFA